MKKFTRKEKATVRQAFLVVNRKFATSDLLKNENQLVDFISQVFSGKGLVRLWQSTKLVSLDQLNLVYKKIVGSDNQDYRSIADMAYFGGGG